MTVTLTAGQSTTLTASLVDSMNHPVASPNLIVWTVDDATVVSIGPNITGDRPLTTNASVTGPLVQVQALAPGSTNVEATYTMGDQVIVQTIILIVNPPDANAIDVTQGPVI